MQISFRYQSFANRASNSFLRRSQATITTPLPLYGDSSGKINELETALKACNEDREKATQTIATLESDVKAATALAAERAEEIKRLEAALAKASVDAVVASEKTAASSVEASAIALEATKLILARAESLEASRKAESLDGLA